MSTQKLVGDDALSAIVSDIKTALGTKADSSSIPTKVSDLTNDSDFQTGDEVDASIAAAVANKADIYGEYDFMVVGNAKQLKSNVGENDKVPYLFRTSGGSIDIGDRETDMLVGGTVVFNQLNKNTDYSYSNDGLTYSRNASNGTISINGTATGDGSFVIDVLPMYLTHKYYISGYKKIGNNRGYIGIAGYNIDTGNGGIYNNTLDIESLTFRLDYRTGDAFENTIMRPMLIDLTQMFGATIADYIHSLEQATAGAGVAWFKRLFNKPYYAYNAGEFISVKTSAHITRGFNAWDEETRNGYYNIDGSFIANANYIASKNETPVIPNTTYNITSLSAKIGRLCFYDINKNFISSYVGISSTAVNHVFTTPDNCYYFNFDMTGGYGSEYKHDICINLHWDGERDGEYEPYVEHEYPLDSDLELRGIPKLDSNNKLYYDGDTYENTGKVTRKYKKIALGVQSWSNITSSSDYAYIMINDRKEGSSLGHIVNLPASILRSRMNDANQGFVLEFTAGTFNNTDELKTALSNSKLVYELATPTEETADPFTNPQLVDDFGTEEYVDNRTIPMPVGHDTFYQANLRAKLEMSPDSPSGNGDYIVRQTNGANEYVPLVIPTELPTVPTTDGTYTLKCTVSNGTASLSWVADE